MNGSINNGDPINNVDSVIEQALYTLRDAQPSAGLESRVLAAALQRRNAPNPSSWLRWTLPLASAVVLLAAIAIHHAQTPAEHPLMAAQGLNIPTQSQPALQTAVPFNAHNSSLTTHRSNLPVQSSGLWADRKTRQLSSTVRDPLGELALEDTHAPSMPAPPLPLTAQERLLLRATRPGSPTELAELGPSREAALRSALDARQKSAVDRYIERTLAPLVASESLNPTPPTPQDEPPGAPEPAANPTKQTFIVQPLHFAFALAFALPLRRHPERSDGSPHLHLHLLFWLSF